VDDVEEQWSDRRAKMVKVWFRSGYDVEYLTNFKKSIENLSGDTLEEMKCQLQEKLNLIRTTNFDDGPRTRLEIIKEEQERMVEIFILLDELVYRGERDD